jgi:hypothetical protein
VKYLNKTIYTGTLDAAIRDAEAAFLPHSDLMVAIRAKNDFKYNSGAGEVVYQILTTPIKTPIEIYTYRPWYPSRAIGYFDGEAIHINLRKLPSMEHRDIVANLVHEACHAKGFSHGSNYFTQEKALYSVPYFASTYILERM